MQRIPPGQRWGIAEGLVGHSADVSDTNLTLMVWYGIEPLVAVDAAAAAALAGQSRIPRIRRFLARRITLESDQVTGRAGQAARGLDALVQLLLESSDPAVQADVLLGIRDAPKGRRNLAMPREWPSLAGKLAHIPKVRNQALAIGLAFGDGAAERALRAIMMDRSADSESRAEAIQSLAENAPREVVAPLTKLLEDPAVRGAAIRALAAFDDPTIPRRVVDRYNQLTEAERADAVSTLASRPGYARLLLASVRDGLIPARDVSPFIARQLQGFGIKDISDELAKVWGGVRPSSQEKRTVMVQYAAALTRQKLGNADLKRGRSLYSRTCAQCHRLFGEGADVGPDLTGSNRKNIDYILENVVDPNAVVARDYKLNVIATKNGRVISGIIRERSDKALVIQTANELVTLPLEEVDEQKESPASMMPEGIFEKLTDDEVRDLVAYLASD
jgi:putative heme-binding domain-containing protein